MLVFCCLNNSFSKDPEEKDFLIKPKNAYEIGDTCPAGGWVFYVAAGLCANLFITDPFTGVPYGDW